MQLIIENKNKHYEPKFYGSVCLTDLIEKSKTKHSSFTKAQNGKIYCNITVWLNDRNGQVWEYYVHTGKPVKGNEDKEKDFILVIARNQNIKNHNNLPIRMIFPEQDDLPF